MIEFKVITLGDSNVGKTTLLQQYIQKGNFCSGSSSIPTIGIEFYSVKTTYENYPIVVQLWDTSGQEKYAPLTKHYCRGAHAILLVFDLTKRSSFENLIRWLQIAKDMNDHNVENNVVFAIIGNKCDLLTKKRRVVTYDEASDLARFHDAFYIDASATEFNNVNQIFTLIIQLMVLKWKQQQQQIKKIIHNIPLKHNEKQQTTDSCC